MRVLLEAIFVGISVALGGLLVTALTKKTNKRLPVECRDWNKYHIMEVTLFLIGFFLHLSFEFLGINSWYCTNGNACTGKNK